jgi:hypothetical protein
MNAMTDKIIIFSKQSGEPPIPITVRVDWLPDGKIKPRMYWTPDGSCYQIKHLYETTPRAYLKDKDLGLRFKILALIIDTPEPYPNQRYARQETYLHFSDNWYCGKNIIDDRYKHTGKEYITVTLDVFPNGGYEPVYFWVKGVRYKVEKKFNVEPRGSFSAGGVGIWHKVEARLVNEGDDEDPDSFNSVRRLAALFFEFNKWFIAVKAV